MKIEIRRQDEQPTTIIKGDDGKISVFVHKADNSFVLMNTAFTPEYGGDDTWEAIGVYESELSAQGALSALKFGAGIVIGAPPTGIEYLQSTGDITTDMRRNFCKNSALDVINTAFGFGLKCSSKDKKHRPHKKRKHKAPANAALLVSEMIAVGNEVLTKLEDSNPCGEAYKVTPEVVELTAKFGRLRKQLKECCPPKPFNLFMCDVYAPLAHKYGRRLVGYLEGFESPPAYRPA